MPWLSPTTLARLVAVLALAWLGCADQRRGPSGFLPGGYDVLFGGDHGGDVGAEPDPGSDNGAEPDPGLGEDAGPDAAADDGAPSDALGASDAGPDAGVDAGPPPSCPGDEPIGAGFTGGHCELDADCEPAGSTCIPDVGCGSCSLPCDVYCDDQAGSPVTFCISADEYASRLDDALPQELYPAMCVSKCDFELFPRTGCRDGLHCELRNRYQTDVQDEVCLPGPWTIGLELSADGGLVLGLNGDEPEPAQPYQRMLSLACAAVYEPIDAELFLGMALTLLAMGPDGRVAEWERLCTAPADLPTSYGLHDQVAAGQAFRLSGSRLEIVDWSAAALYGSKAAKGVLVGGPLYTSRAMVFRDGSSYLYTDAADDHPHYDPARGRHFGVILGDEWGPLDAQVEPDADFVVIKADGSARFYRQWGRVETAEYIADMAIDHLVQHGLPLGVGDFSLPTGGDIDGHGSHETGRDVDLYLLTYDEDAAGELVTAAPLLWVCACEQSDGWDCWYYEDDTGALEDLDDPAHVPAASQLTTLAQFAYDHPGPSHFVQHDVTVLGAFADLPGSTPLYIDASNNSALGWPVHANHVHVRFVW